MVEVVCPGCGVKDTFQKAELTLYNQITCDACGATLEVVEEDPLVVEVADDLSAGEDDYDEDDDDS